jgi:hypothetical protein
MKTPSLIRAIDRDLDEGHAAVIQIVSTGEALMRHRLSEIPTEEWGDVRVDITPREYVLDYLAHSFPVQLYEFTDSEGNLSSRPVYRDDRPVESREALARRGWFIEKLALLAPPGALDQIVQRFGTDVVAEVTGRSRRIVRKSDRLTVENRARSANLAETAALDLTEGLKLRRVRAMGMHRIELSDFADTIRDGLRAYGLFSEIISWKLRVFVPTDDHGVGVLAKVLERYPVERIGEREVA